MHKLRTTPMAIVVADVLEDNKKSLNQLGIITHCIA